MVPNTAAPDGKTIFPAPHGLRLAAWLIDLLLVGIVFSVLPQPLSYLLFIALFITYHTLLIWLMQQTFGKALFGLKVTWIEDRHAVFKAFGRSSLGYFIVNLFGLGLLTALFNRHHRCLHDIVFGSLVTFKGKEAIKAQTFFALMTEFAERQKKAVAEKKKSFTVLAAFWSFLVWLGNMLNKFIAWLVSIGSGPAASGSASSIAAVVTTKIAAGVTAGAIVVTGAVVANTPAIDWLVTPRYFFVEPIVSTFDHDTQGWKVDGDGKGPIYENGSLRTIDEGAGIWWYWHAPDHYYGDLRRFYGRHLLFQMKTNPSGGDISNFAVVLKGNELALKFKVDTAPKTEWTPYSIRLHETNAWLIAPEVAPRSATREDMLKVLSNVDQLLIRGEYSSSIDTGWLDNVILGAKVSVETGEDH